MKLKCDTILKIIAVIIVVKLLLKKSSSEGYSSYRRYQTICATGATGPSCPVPASMKPPCTGAQTYQQCEDMLTTAKATAKSASDAKPDDKALKDKYDQATKILENFNKCKANADVAMNKSTCESKTSGTPIWVWVAIGIIGFIILFGLILPCLGNYWWCKKEKQQPYNNPYSMKYDY
jgi:cobalamin biosynthesis Mg chelatase CobN